MSFWYLILSAIWFRDCFASMPTEGFDSFCSISAHPRMNFTLNYGPYSTKPSQVNVTFFPSDPSQEHVFHVYVKSWDANKADLEIRRMDNNVAGWEELSVTLVWSVGFKQQKGLQNCKDIYDTGQRHNGIYDIQVVGYNGEAMKVYCDMETDGGGWLVGGYNTNVKLEGIEWHLDLYFKSNKINLSS
uniref:tenascin-N-like n=1 Tax=Ciona intestinalis TaxID=7719 RepID=UPI000EF46A01|nr:tenascin-N-like [Ciona intestinalis]|eukprot:XP_026692432.1 tenascin-N-like [Ciona intestinalis]